MRLLICGSRSWKDFDAIRHMIEAERTLAEEAGSEFVVIHGANPKGADRMADAICLKMGMKPGKDLIREPADWARYKRAAGPIRNQAMIDKHQPEKVYAFRAPGKSNGTDDMVQKAEAAGIPTRVISRVDA